MLAAHSAAFAQASPSAGTYAARYDLMRREVGTIAPDPDGAAPWAFLATRKTYDAGGRLTKVESGVLGSWPSESVAPLNWSDFSIVSQVDTAYDVMGRKVRDAASGVAGATLVTTGVTEYSYDLASRLKCTAMRMNPDVWATALLDKCVPGAAHPTHGPDRIARNSYTVHGEILKVERAVGTGLQQAYASYAYSSNGKQTSVTDANGNRAEMSYDGLDRQKRWIFPSKTVPGETNGSDYEEYGYDANGNRTSLRKRDGSVLAFQYDSLNRMTARIVPERAGLTAAQTRDVYYHYDLRGLQTRARFDSLAGEGVTTSYDGFGRVSSSTSSMGGAGRTMNSQYDANGNRLVLSGDSGYYAPFSYDGLDRMTAYQGMVSIGYDAAGRRSGLAMGAGAPTSTVAYAYDGVGRLSGLAHNLAGPGGDQSLALAYHPASQIVAQTTSNDAYAWTGSVAVNRPYSVNGQNQYVAAGPATFAYDANGNPNLVEPLGMTIQVLRGRNRRGRADR